jgi:hypothetical protein
MSFTHVQGKVISQFVSSVTTLSLVLSSAPTTGNLVCVGFLAQAQNVSALTVKDSNNNSYTVTPNSPATQSSCGAAFTAYLLSAPSNASATITATWTTASNAAIWADEFSYTGGSAVFDKDLAGTGTTGTTINTPVLVPAGAGELGYVQGLAQGSISAPAAGATLGSWTGSAGAITNGNMAEYALNLSASTAADFTQSSGAWAAMGMLIKIVAGGTPTPGIIYSPIGEEHQFFSGDIQ